MPQGEYGTFSDLYAFVTYFLVILTFGMETSFWSIQFLLFLPFIVLGRSYVYQEIVADRSAMRITLDRRTLRNKEHRVIPLTMPNCASVERADRNEGDSIIHVTYNSMKTDVFKTSPLEARRIVDELNTYLLEGEPKVVWHGLDA